MPSRGTPPARTPRDAHGSGASGPVARGFEAPDDEQVLQEVQVLDLVVELRKSIEVAKARRAERERDEALAKLNEQEQG